MNDFAALVQTVLPDPVLCLRLTIALAPFVWQGFAVEPSQPGEEEAVADTAGAAADDGPRVTLKLERPEFFLGESIAV